MILLVDFLGTRQMLGCLFDFLDLKAAQQAALPTHTSDGLRMLSTPLHDMLCIAPLGEPCCT